LEVCSSSEFSAKSDECNIEEEFKKYDLNDDGFISVDEVRQVMLSLETGHDNDEVENKIMKADTNGDGMISFTEFIKHFL
jgi:Ca2+-binding EF-hand superfamily protein